MLSNVNPALPSPLRPELLPPLAPYGHRPQSSAACAPRRSSDHAPEPQADASSEQNIQKRTAPAPAPAPAREQLLQHHGFHSPRPSLSPLPEYHSGFSDADYTPDNSHRRQQSFPNLLPLSFRSRTPSPTRKSPQLPEPMPYTGENRGPPGDSSSKAGGQSGGLVGWFNMSATQDADRTPDATPTKLRRRPTNASSNPTTPQNTKNTAASRFMSALSSKFAGGTPSSTPASPIIDDEICNLNIEAALFPPTMSPPTSPTGSSSNRRDSFSPAAFKNLEMNALGLLTKMQSAYRDRVATLKEIEAEKLAQREELEEAETRARHLKMQLEGMAHMAQKQEEQLARLVAELAAERKGRAEEQRQRLTPPAAVSEGSVVCSEDLGVEEGRRRRKWSGETGKVSEETDDDESAESESLFSRCRSPALTVGGQMEGEGAPSQRGGLAPPPPPPTRAKQPQLSAFQRIIKGIAGEETNGCSNCQGKDASVAWNTLSVLRDENRHLKVRMSELEVAVEGALDLVNGVGLG
ncbi:hypothetical protein QBC39DRAFT_15871 [Podospora conica]|nr:hypothetical protein QBC39DRAFT_15871 [Schizothecium conicum]